MGRVRVAGLLALVAACGRTSVDAADDSTGAITGTNGDGGEVGPSPASSSASTTGDGTTTAIDDGSEGQRPDADVPTGCGDGSIGAGELCDDGNDVAADGCNPDCLPSGHVRWMVELPSTDISDWAIHERLAVGPAGEVALVGPSASADGTAILTVLGSDGAVAVERTIDLAQEVRPLGVAFLVEGEITVVGDARQGNGPRVVWRQTLAGATFDPIAALEVHDAHGVAIDAFASGPDDGFAWALDHDGLVLERRDAVGDVVWSEATADAAIDALAVDPIDGDIAAGGDFPVDMFGGSPDVALWSSAGALVWTLDLQELTAHAFVDRIAMTLGGEIVLLAGQFPPPGDQLGIVALSRGARVSWRHENYELGAIDDAHELPSMRDVTIDAVGDIVVVGWASRTDGGSDPWLLKLDPTGALRWQTLVPSPDPAAPYDYGLMVATAPDTSIIVAGRRGTNPGDLTWVMSTTP